ncbi:RnfABCDGE type electron transport complex subunit D [Pseudoruegeria sp. HB172150]|uniref:RnfABCDGE type electron transport complex subunit D n=1 Tax=Pseudoruegeria sp. HB172150 TaxID=2721164 RepID=UPI0015571EC6|nr:RnfABCDGE type electron transport complex subunit D [Pseudoruegeria sp. HB172150]
MIRGIWDRETVALMLLAAAFPVFVAWVQADGWYAIGRLIFFLVVAGIWHVIFMLARAQPPSFAGALTALTIAILAPHDLGIFALLLGTSFGVVMAELAFGGWGRNVLNPAVVALAFISFGYPASNWPELAVQIGWAAFPAALIGVLTGVMSLRLLLGVAVVTVITLYAGVDISETWIAGAVVLVLMVCDPVTASATRLGRWAYGAFYAAMFVLFTCQWGDAAPIQIAVAAALLASLAAPLFDEIAISIWLYRRNRRIG